MVMGIMGKTQGVKMARQAEAESHQQERVPGLAVPGEGGRGRPRPGGLTLPCSPREWRRRRRGAAGSMVRVALAVGPVARDAQGVVAGLVAHLCGDFGRRPPRRPACRCNVQQENRRAFVGLGVELEVGSKAFLGGA